MSPGRLRAITVSLFIAAGVFSVVARKSNEGWATGISFALFVLGVGVYFRWRRALRAKVLDWRGENQLESGGQVPR